MAGLPPSVIAAQEFSPIEDLLLAALAYYLPDVKAGTLIMMAQTFPFIHLRRLDSYGVWAGDERFIDDAHMAIYAYAEDPDGDEDAGRLAEAVRASLMRARRARFGVPELGHFVGLTMTASPRRVPDWATATGPVQYADLPAGVWRYETRFDVTVRRPRQQP
ncbi:hypothetical protein [Salinispora tropica]|uniref:Tail terminator n=1 Tax=Salinispora tropica (strain ATCC BAA-916 / DSM 44818 / JCM 13857 / NBRC 105044 / CNB-440) TaxID=369723 RepID=A4X2C0_SALTO|nr:hypothetical protein [Salinispora tropica]ABP53020.1 hypothetical protein Strop_0537 [Salinispora tropica CNB-440]